MSTGMVVCSECFREVHQDGPGSTWRHCEDKSPRCPRAGSIYPVNKGAVVGKACGRDNIGEGMAARAIISAAFKQRAHDAALRPSRQKTCGCWAENQDGRSTLHLCSVHWAEWEPRFI